MIARKQENEQLKQLIAFVIISSIPMLFLSIYIGYLSHSLSVMAIIIDSGIALLLNLISYYVLIVISRSNVFQFPSGTGKLENFTGFFHGCGMLLLGITIIYNAIVRLDTAQTSVSLGIAQFAFILGIIRLVFIVLWISRIINKHAEPSPILNVYYLSFKAAIWYVSALFISMLAGWLLTKTLKTDISLYVDVVIALLFSVYSIWNGSVVVRTNFRALIDLPIAEIDLLKVLKVLSSNYDSYINLVNVYTHYSGSKRNIQIEIALRNDTTVATIEQLRSGMNKELLDQFPELDFKLIARGDV